MTVRQEKSPFIQACRREPVPYTPVWYMRQAGRSLPEYRALRERWKLVEIVAQPELCAEVTLQPVRRHGVDAAVMFADIMLPLIGIGVELELVEAIGPVIARPVRDEEGVNALRPLEPEEDVDFVLASIRATLARLDGEVPLIGFSGAPFTLASYLIEGRPSRDFVHTKRFMYSRPDLWERLMQRLADLVTSYARAQVAAGIHAFQLFDSWVGTLSLDDYVRYVRPYTRPIFEALEEAGVPSITFGTGTAGLLESMRNTGGDAVGV
ncbi:MAG TPA: uroporphyrinogen decarboxylase, partial [Streptosporangiaceae bacterium]|nr:uroporphyrinogen decarboxylase [Streptosporangiaceae bacterium]